MEIGTVRQVDIDSEMQAAYLDYAMSVIVARALPDVRDGLKPVHRRILYAMHDMGLSPDKPYRKSARIVGEVLGKYHPHGDAAVYDSMVRMAQDFSMRYLLVDGQGNFGSIDGDEAAAMRYTEARLTHIATEMLADIEKNTVAFGPNFDGTLEEPLVLPSAVPNFLVNGASGIAVGMATNVPPHNLSEVCDALAYMIDHHDAMDDITVEELMQFIRGPDFPTGGIVYRYGQDNNDGRIDAIKSAYAVGRGRFVIQARAHIEEMSRNRSRIVVTELPYQVNKTRLIERIAELTRDGRLEGITDLRDESDRQGMRLVIELTRNVEPKDMLGKLFKLTPMQSTFGVNLLALVDGEPRTLSLKRALSYFLQHRQEIVTRRTEFDLDKAQRQAHILEGLLIALDNLDEVIQTIRRSRDSDTARSNLTRKFKLTEIQAQAILEMPLRRLAALEQKKIREEYKEKLALIAYLKDLLSDPHKILSVIRDELRALKQNYGDARRTLLVDRSQELVVARDLVEEEDVLIAISGDLVWREPAAGHRRGTALNIARQGLVAAVVGKTTGDLAIFTADGQGAAIPVHHIPVGAESASRIAALLNVTASVDPTAAVFLSSADLAEDSSTKYLFLTSSLGKVKRIALADFYGVATRGLTVAMAIEPPDRLIGVSLSEEDQEIILIASSGQAIRFNLSEVRPMGLPAGGVAGMKLDRGGQIVGMGIVRPKAEAVLATMAGYAKRTPVEDYPAQRRYGAGIVAHRVSSRTGPVVGGCVVTAQDELFFVTEKGKVSGMTPTQIPAQGRAAAGRIAIALPSTDRLAHLVSVDYSSVTSKLPSDQGPRTKKAARHASSAVTPDATQLALEAATGSGPKSRRSRKAASPKTAKKQQSAPETGKRRKRSEASADAKAPAQRATGRKKSAAPAVAPDSGASSQPSAKTPSSTLGAQGAQKPASAGRGRVKSSGRQAKLQEATTSAPKASTRQDSEIQKEKPTSGRKAPPKPKSDSDQEKPARRSKPSAQQPPQEVEGRPLGRKKPDAPGRPARRRVVTSVPAPARRTDQTRKK